MISTRNATIEDAEDITTVHVKSWQSAYKGIISQRFLDNIQFEQRLKMWKIFLTNRIEGHIALVLCSQNKIIGFAKGKPKTEDLFFLYALYIHPDYTGKGYGECLITAFKQECSKRKFLKMACHVLTENKRACQFYKKKS